MSDKDIFNMSDEEFLKNYGKDSDYNSEPEEKGEEQKAEPEIKEEIPVPQEEDNLVPVDEENNSDSNESEIKTESKEIEPENNEVQTEPKVKTVRTKIKTGSKPKENTSDVNEEKTEVETKQNNSDKIETKNDVEPDYKALYQKIMAPFKADGKTIQLKDVNEAIALMQKGVNYTRKTQNLAKYQKSILSLENANLLDNGKLNNLINIAKGDKEAIKQLLAEHKIDPMDLSSENYDGQPSNYVPRNNLVDDAYVNFKGALDEVQGTLEGQAVIRDLLNSDDRTKSEVYQDPRLIGLLVQQKQNGIYDTVMGEVQRRKTIGLIPDSVPLIYAYNQVGQELTAQGRLSQMQGKNNNVTGNVVNPSGSAVSSQAPAPMPPKVNTQSKPANSFNNNARARAAATTRMTPAADKQVRNPLSLSDDEFMKQYGTRY